LPMLFLCSVLAKSSLMGTLMAGCNVSEYRELADRANRKS
jgi:hypothetical protein